MFLLPLFLLQSAPDTVLIDTARARTRAEIPCDITSMPDEIFVCGQREADKKYRVTFIATDPRDSVMTVRERLLEPKLPGCGRVGTSFSDCGYVGMSVSTSGQGPVRLKTRQLAP